MKFRKGDKLRNRGTLLEITETYGETILELRCLASDYKAWYVGEVHRPYNQHAWLHWEHIPFNVHELIGELLKQYYENR